MGGAMSIAELTEKVQFVTNANGERQAVQISIEAWEELLTILEDMEDAAERAQARKEEDESIPWAEARLQYPATE
jgi:hypothetical protein